MTKQTGYEVRLPISDGARAIIMDAVNTLQKVCHGDAVNAGWHNDIKTGLPRTQEQRREMFPVRLMLIVSELGEAMEGHRKGLMDDKLPHRSMAEVELADTCIRAFDLAGEMGFDLAGAIVEKLEYNRNRADHKLENRAKAGGKAY